ncbi:PAS sensor protein [Candidatus Sulfopaludibacter sp. SbA6]|nr:PAS sensor protein [Candidatus Sulfopaludibacter sp. SbA6]
MPRSRSGRVRAPRAYLSLTAKGVLVVAIPVCALLAAMVVFYQFQQRMRDAGASVEHTYQVRVEMRRVFIRLVNAETAVRGYLLTRRESFLEPYLTARKELPDRLDALHRLASDSPEQLQRWSRVRALVARALDSMEALRHAAAGVPELESAESDMDELRAELTAMENEEDRLLMDRSAAQERAQQRLRAAIFVGGLLGLLGGIGAAVLFNAKIARRVRQLEEDARGVAKGQPILAKIAGNDEIARLGRTLKETSELLTQQAAELKAAHGLLESKVDQRTADLGAANEELRQANEVRQAVVQSSPLAIWAVDLEGKVTFWNPAAQRIFGWTQEEVIGGLPPIIPADEQEEQREWLERFRRGESLAAAERSRLKKDGSRIDIVIWTAPLRDAGGRIRGVIAIDSDVTERKVLEEQFRQSQKLEAVGRLAGGVAHDFNNLLTVITGYTEMLILEAQGSPDLLEYAHEIQYSAACAGSLTAQLLAFSRRQISQPRIVDLNGIVSRSIKMLSRLIPEDIEISTHLDAGLGRVSADPVHIDQVIMNLVVNARDAMSDGGKLTIETANAALDADYAGRHLGVTPGQYCMLAVSDTGVGMDAATRSRLFEPFFTTKEEGKGTGLGLSIVYGIVKQNGGEIMVYSEPGQGTTFKIYFPTVEVPVEFTNGEDRPGQMRGTETILLCEDEEGIRKLVHKMLARQGYRVLEAETPEQALEVARQHGQAIDLLLTDLVMPHLSGLELAKAVRDLRPAAKVVYMSGYTDNRITHNWVLDPETAFLQKPFTAADLSRKLREVLGSSAAA